MNFFISDAMAEGAAAPQGGGLQMIIMMAIFFGIMYFMIIRPQQKRAKEHRELISSIGKGDEVVAAGGLVGKVVDLGDNLVEITVSENTTLKVQRQAIVSVLPKGTMKGL
ncbi:preprotein translocase subunit YajC [Leucothrix arctica]|uniref:Sec translocon accessory complex subunit YajC n=1 Tax=Leucothrix arctica TaxID=1481894 RepID=A0A317CKF5_9GAMM|nr:preprotein translocase subunit YajC [Leucothrix arctica]PWQ98986.1 preprotein translocase subunit YajC [Leucothrix arctica]